jgi:acyl-CoA hydrolase
MNNDPDDDVTPARDSTPTPPTAAPTDHITLRFLALPTDVTASGASVAAGRVLEWIDRAGYACAVGWSASYCVTAYVGNVMFTHPIHSGELVEVHARIVYTGRTSMHVLVTVESSNIRSRHFSAAMSCILIFVAVDEAGKPHEVPSWTPWGDAELTLSARAAARIDTRSQIQDAMRAMEYTDASTAPRTVFRFLAAPGDINWGGKAHGGTVMRWIDETAFACAASWSSENAVAVYSGGIQFYRPVHIGHIVEVDARLIHTTDRSMHVSVHVRSGSPQTPHDLQLTTHCMSVFVDLGDDGRASRVPQLPLITGEDRALDAHARQLVALRASMPVMPAGLARG